MLVKRSCMLPGNGSVDAGCGDVMQVEAGATVLGPTPHDRVYDLGSLLDPAEHFGRPVAEIGMQPIPLSRAELVAALSLSQGLTVEDLNAMTVTEVGRDIAGTVLFRGLYAVQDAAERDQHDDCSGDEALSAFLDTCGRRVDELLAGQTAGTAQSDVAGNARAVDAAAGW
jgi:hypothetical protein